MELVERGKGWRGGVGKEVEWRRVGEE